MSLQVNKIYSWSARRCAGLKTLLSVEASRKLSEHSSATLGATYVAGVGLGMRFSTNRRLGVRTEAVFDWTLGGAGSGGVGLSLTHRFERVELSSRLEVRSLRIYMPGTRGRECQILSMHDEKVK